MNAVSASWRSVVEPRSLPPAHIAFWDQAFAAMVRHPDWQEAVRKNQWEDEYLNSTETLRFMQAEYLKLEAVLTELGGGKK